MKSLLILLLSIPLIFAGCVAHNISEKSLALVDRTVTFDMLQDNPDAYLGKFVVFGGRIETAEKQASGIRLEIKQYAIDSRELPDETTASRGRFLAMAPASLDMGKCRKGRLVSIAGVVAGKEILPFNGADYTYPVINVKEMHLFPCPGEDAFHTWSPDNPR
ncbi:MAG TPA: Slp family lipoprotein [Geobacteraceae bacterium]|nr:Slp family lipoprotein [Geobacteraceae bacterium]